MSKRRIIGTVLLFSAFAAFGAVYKFYFEEKLQSYRQDQEMLERLQTTREDLENFFSYVQPDILTEQWRSQVEPWSAALDERETYFHFGDWQEFPEYPGDGPILRFWYQDQVDEMRDEYYQMVYQQMGRYDLVPDLVQVMNIMTIDTWNMMDGDEEFAHMELARLSFAMSFMEMLLDYDVQAVANFSMWPRDRGGANQLLVRQTVGLQVYVTPNNLVRLLEEMRTADRYFSVDALKIAYPYVGYDVEPQLIVDLLVTQARFRMPEQTDTGMGLAMDTGGNGEQQGPQMPGMDMGMGPGMGPNMMFPGMGGQQQNMQPPPEPGVVERSWRWFKRHVLYMN